MKLLVCGGRDYRDRDLVWMTLSAAVHYADLSEIICGYDPESSRYQGADQLAYEWAVEHEFPCRTFPADWDTWGRAAGPRRNTQMADDKPDECVAFPRANGEWGAGTLDMIGKAARAGAQVHRVTRLAEGSPEAAGSEGEAEAPGRIPNKEDR